MAATSDRAHCHGEPWMLANEYPATSLPGEGDAFFAKLVADGTEGRLCILCMPDAQLGYRSREQLKAVAGGEIALADSFGGALGEEQAIFGLASLPFVVADIAMAAVLFRAARGAYERAFEQHNQKLLYSTPWPPSGLWTKTRVTNLEALGKLRIRAYDRAGADLFARVGAAASVVSFAELPQRLASGEIDAVLSSGDGGAGDKLWYHLPHFTEINYAIALSFTTVNLDKWGALDAPTRRAVEDAAALTEARQWKESRGRLARNYARMHEHGMSIHSAQGIEPALRARLREAGLAAVQAWSAKAGAQARALLDELR